MHFAAGDHVDAGGFLLQDGGLRGAELCVGKIAGRKLAEHDQAIERFVPAGNAVGADDGRCVCPVMRHRCSPVFARFGIVVCGAGVRQDNGYCREGKEGFTRARRSLR